MALLCGTFTPLCSPRGPRHPRHTRTSIAAWRDGYDKRQDKDGDKEVTDFMEGSAVSPRWRWPSWNDGEKADTMESSRRGPPPPPPPPPPSFNNSPFDFWQGQQKIQKQPLKRGKGDGWNFGDFSIRDKGKGAGMNALASRLYRNKEIRELAEQDAARKAAADKEDANLASASRSSSTLGTSMSDSWSSSQWGGGMWGGRGEEKKMVPEEFESDREFYEWMEKKRKVMAREREERQEDEIWGIARVYFVLAVAIIFFALASTLG